MVADRHILIDIRGCIVTKPGVVIRVGIEHVVEVLVEIRIHRNIGAALHLMSHLVHGDVPLGQSTISAAANPSTHGGPS